MEIDEQYAAPVEFMPTDSSTSITKRKSKPKPKLNAVQVMTAEEREIQESQKAAIARYGRGEKIPTKGIKTRRLRENMKKMETRYKDAAIKAQDAELLLEEQAGLLEAEGLEKTFHFKQSDIVKEVDISTAKKSFELKLPNFGPYSIDYNRSGKDLLIGGRKGHIAAFDWRSSTLHTEIQLKETIRDVKWLHGSEFFAVAQKKYVYIYDRAGVEVHCLKKHIEVTAMEFLPYHFLLASVGNAGWLKYQDTSTGDLVCEYPTKLGVPSAMTQNPHNAIIHVGHANGTVTLWSPSMSTPLVKMLCHRGPIRALSMDREGRYMASAGQDSKLNIWDIRMYKEVHSYFTPTPASSLHTSDRGLLAVGWGPHVTVWQDAFRTKQKTPYLQHLSAGNTISDVRFCPFEDVLGYGHSDGFESLIVPGAGEANFDALEVNPYETRQQRRENEVQTLLNKLKPEMISLNPDFIGEVDRASSDVRQREVEEDINSKKGNVKLVVHAKQRGKNSSLRRHLRKTGKKNIIDERRMKLEAMKEKRIKAAKGEDGDKDRLGPALSRFQKSTDR